MKTASEPTSIAAGTRGRNEGVRVSAARTAAAYRPEMYKAAGRGAGGLVCGEVAFAYQPALPAE